MEVRKSVNLSRGKLLYFHKLTNGHASANYNLDSKSSYIEPEMNVFKIVSRKKFGEKLRDNGKECTGSFNYYI